MVTVIHTEDKPVVEPSQETLERTQEELIDYVHNMSHNTIYTEMQKEKFDYVLHKIEKYKKDFYKKEKTFLSQEDVDILLEGYSNFTSNETLFTEDIINLLKENIEKSKRTEQTIALKLAEECGEVAEAVLQLYEDHNYKHLKKEDIIKECGDVIVVAMSLILKLNPNFKESDLQPHILNQLLRWKDNVENN